MTDEPDVTPELTDEPTVDPELTEEPTEEPEESLEPTEAPTFVPAETMPGDTSEPTEIPDLTFDPIDITGGDWNGNNGARREKLKWLIPAGIGTILAVSAVFLIIASRKRDQ